MYQWPTRRCVTSWLPSTHKTRRLRSSKSSGNVENASMPEKEEPTSLLPGTFRWSMAPCLARGHDPCRPCRLARADSSAVHAGSHRCTQRTRSSSTAVTAREFSWADISWIVTTLVAGCRVKLGRTFTQVDKWRIHVEKLQLYFRLQVVPESAWHANQVLVESIWSLRGSDSSRLNRATWRP